MNACRFAILTPVILILLVGSAAAQAPAPPAAETPPSTPALPLGAIPQFPPTQVPGVPDMGFPPAPTNVQPGFPDLQPLPSGLDQIGTPPSQPRIQQSNNPLLKLFDTDGDGTLSGDEVEQASARLWELDRNFDAELSTQELGLILAPRWQERRRGVPGHLPDDPMQVEPQLPEPTDRKLGDERPQFQVYPLRGLDPRGTLATLQQLLQGQPEVRLTYDGRTRSILALAPADTHAAIRKSLAEMLQGDRAGIPGFPPDMETGEVPEATVPVVPRPVPLYNVRAADILRVIKQVYRDRITEPATDRTAADPRFPGIDPLPNMDEPTVPAGKMVIGEGAAPNTIVVSAEDKLFFEVLDLIERLDEQQEPPADEMAPPPVN